MKSHFVVFLFFLVALPSYLFAQSTSPATHNPVRTLILAGDGGDVPSYVISAIAEQAAHNPKLTSVYLLGDNIYPAGLFTEGHPLFADSHDKLMRQIRPLKDTGARIVFIPGNHDWASPGKSQDGLEAVRRQGDMVTSLLGEGAYYPKKGCPGPVIVEDLPQIRVIALDSQWFLHKGSKPEGIDSGCETGTEEEVVQLLSKYLTSTSAPSIVLQHHPLKSSGPHGNESKCMQDAGCPAYDAMRALLFRAFTPKKPLLCVAGHDHILEFLKGGEGCEFFGVSGTMSYPTSVTPRSEALYSSVERGFIQLEIFADKRVLVRIFTITKSLLSSIKTSVVYEQWIPSAGNR